MGLLTIIDDEEREGRRIAKIIMTLVSKKW